MAAPTQPKVCLHFGCIDRPGHFVHSPDGSPVDYHMKHWIQKLDSLVHAERTDRWLTHWFEAEDGSQITVIARRDNEIDSRPGSWCGFIMPGNSPLETALRVAREAWPKHHIWDAPHGD